uniref:Uncharacterized protein n=1 Tax=Solanum lycopersicum TaxID=4081 RepID=A0A3Q7JLK7_SOLLC
MQPIDFSSKINFLSLLECYLFLGITYRDLHDLVSLKHDQMRLHELVGRQNGLIKMYFFLPSLL